jgi:hypothetical protein
MAQDIGHLNPEQAMEELLKLIRAGEVVSVAVYATGKSPGGRFVYAYCPQGQYAHAARLMNGLQKMWHEFTTAYLQPNKEELDAMEEKARTGATIQ